MEERYPLMIDGTQTGEVTLRKEGGWTVVDVRCAPLDGIVRVSVYGEAREGYLGVLAPEGEGLALHRRLSRSALREFPAQITHAGRAGEPCPEETEAETPPVDAAPEEEKAPEPKTEAEGAPPENEEAPPLEDVGWYASPDGALVCFDGEQNLIALPVGDARIPAGGGGWQRTIEEKDYVVFRTKNGRLLR